MAEAAFSTNPPTLPLKNVLLHFCIAEHEQRRIVNHVTFVDKPRVPWLLIWARETENESNPKTVTR